MSDMIEVLVAYPDARRHRIVHLLFEEGIGVVPNDGEDQLETICYAINEGGELSGSFDLDDDELDGELADLENRELFWTILPEGVYELFGKPVLNKGTKIGTVGIDAGMLYLGDPCYIAGQPLGAKPWDEFLREMYASQPEGDNARWWTVQGTAGGLSFPAGMVTTTGYGDGEYPVYVELGNDRAVKSVTVEFIRE